MKPENKAKPITVNIPVANEADRKRVAAFCRALSRQIGYQFTTESVFDKQGNEYQMGASIMNRGGQAAVAMFMRRGEFATDTAKGKELLKASEVYEAIPVAVMKDKGLTKTTKEGKI